MIIDEYLEELELFVVLYACVEFFVVPPLCVVLSAVVSVVSFCKGNHTILELSLKYIYSDEIIFLNYE